MRVDAVHPLHSLRYVHSVHPVHWVHPVHLVHCVHLVHRPAPACLEKPPLVSSGHSIGSALKLVASLEGKRL